MNDIFYEQILSTKNAPKTLILRMVTFFGTFLACLTCFLFFGLLCLPPIFLILVIVFYLINPRLNKEYEYSLSNFYFDVAAVYNKEKRKEKLEIDIRDAEILAPTTSPRLGGFRPVKTLDFSSGIKGAKTYTFMIAINKVLHKIVIEPDETMLQFLKDRMGMRIYMD